MLKRIIVGISKTPFSQAAAGAAIAWAKRESLELVGIAVVNPAAVSKPEFVPLGSSAFKAHRDQVLLEQSRDEAERSLHAFEDQCREAGVACRAFLEEGDPAAVLNDWAEKADLLMVGRKRGLTVGSENSRTLENILRRATRPVLAVPAEGLRESQTAVIAYDGSPAAAKTLQAFESLGLAAGKTLHVVSVTVHGEESSPVVAAAEYLRLHEREVHAVSEVSTTAPAEFILSEAEKRNAGVIVMGSFGHSGIAELFFGSVTQRILNAALLPLFLYH